MALHPTFINSLLMCPESVALSTTTSSTGDKRISDLLHSYADVITTRIGRCDVLPYGFHLKDAIPICVPYTGFSSHNLMPFRKIIEVAKRNRHCPSVSGKVKIFSLIDLDARFHQCPIQCDCRKFTAFCTPWAQYEFNSIPIGTSFGTQASYVLDYVLSDLKFQFVFNYIDDIIAYILNRFRKAGLMDNLNKVTWSRTSIPFSGYIILLSQLLWLPSRVAPIVRFSRPKTLKGVMYFVKILCYYTCFISGFAELAAPLNILKRKKTRNLFRDLSKKLFSTL
ncbi:hypothetical protein PR048_011496 [Dryococelus australis]|uniref:Reverse transcriptase domain-containing protein n=1 Tax=Dryococelus australis TaxID=614101 RepID=A0ABQ9HLP3_9NEOP|nr:hypothetical protein PR048_011496 [Dryococelus australis]